MLSFGLDLNLQAFKLMRLTAIFNKFVLLSFKKWGIECHLIYNTKIDIKSLVEDDRVYNDCDIGLVVLPNFSYVSIYLSQEYYHKQSW